MRTRRRDFKAKQKQENNYYDLFDDYSLIEASFLEQYGIRLRQTEDMSWDEFCTYLSGLNEKTSLGKMVAIRSEKDPEIIKNMTPEQKRIRREWEKKQAGQMSEEDAIKIQMAMAAGFRQSFLK